MQTTFSDADFLGALRVKGFLYNFRGGNSAKTVFVCHPSGSSCSKLTMSLVNDLLKFTLLYAESFC